MLVFKFLESVFQKEFSKIIFKHLIISKLNLYKVQKVFQNDYFEKFLWKMFAIPNSDITFANANWLTGFFNDSNGFFL